jgi:ankyrin repeat protein
MLVEKGAELRARDDVGQTPLHKAAMVGHGVVIRLLLEAGAEARGQDYVTEVLYILYKCTRFYY